MTQYSFLDDYSEGCHPAILTALANTNTLQQTAYGEDEYSQKAKSLIKKKLDNDDAEIFFVSSGTLANIIIIASCLRPHEAVIAPESGHITVRETGAIEATGHKIITVPPIDGKLTPDSIQYALDKQCTLSSHGSPSTRLYFQCNRNWNALQQNRVRSSI